VWYNEYRLSCFFRKNNRGWIIMICVYTSVDKIPGQFKGRYQPLNDIFFNRKFRFEDLGEIDFGLIGKIDNAYRIPNLEQFETPFGITDIYNLSTGCKTVLNVLHFRDMIFDCTECGGNALAALFDLIDETAIIIVLSHARFILPGGVQLFVDGENVINSRLRFSAYLGKERAKN